MAVFLNFRGGISYFSFYPFCAKKKCFNFDWEKKKNGVFVNRTNTKKKIILGNEELKYFILPSFFTYLKNNQRNNELE